MRDDGIEVGERSGPEIERDFVDLTSELVMARYLDDARKPADVVETPWQTWNRACRDDGGSLGPAKGWQVVIAGITSSGKSLIALNWAWEAVRRGEHVVFFTAEMSPKQIATRFLAIATHEPVAQLERGESFSEEARQRAHEKIITLRHHGGGSFLVNTVSMAGLSRLGPALDWYEGGPMNARVFFFDYLQLFAQDTGSEWHREITEISRHIQRFARERSALCVEISQFSRQQQSSERPSIFNLKQSSNLEQDADQVVLIDHVKQTFNKPTRERFQWLILGKNRHGPTVNVPVIWNYSTLRCRELAIDDGEQIPHWVPDQVARVA